MDYAKYSFWLETLPIAQRRSPKWEPEPLRWLAARYAQKAFLRIDEAAENGRARPPDPPVAEFLGKPLTRFWRLFR